METVRIGDHVLPVVPQRHARLRHKLSPDDFQAIMSKDYGRESYRVLSILIPELPRQIPLYEWEGYESEEAMEKDLYDEEKDKSPTTAEMVNAFETAFLVSGAGRMGKIVELIQLGQTVQPLPQSSETSTQTSSSPESSGANGGSPSTSTGQRSQTTAPSEGSPSPE